MNLIVSLCVVVCVLIYLCRRSRCYGFGARSLRGLSALMCGRSDAELVLFRQSASCGVSFITLPVEVDVNVLRLHVSKQFAALTNIYFYQLIC